VLEKTELKGEEAESNRKVSGSESESREARQVKRREKIVLHPNEQSNGNKFLMLTVFFIKCQSENCMSERRELLSKKVTNVMHM
jgi:hypothetical protein